MCHILKVLLSNEEYRHTKIIYYTSQEPSDVTNAIYLIGAFLCLQMNLSAGEGWQPFSSMPAGVCLPYRDATWARSPYDLSCLHCWGGC